MTRLAAIPGVARVGGTTNLPLQDYGTGCTVVFRPGEPYHDDEKTPCVFTPRATPGFFRTLDIQVSGHAPEWSDVDGRTQATVITKALADRVWPGQDPIGKGINSNSADNVNAYRIVGVIPELRLNGLDQPPSEAVFYPATSFTVNSRSGAMNDLRYVLKVTTDDPLALVPSVRAILNRMDSRIPLVNPVTMQQVVDRSMARTSFIMLLLGIAACMALLLSAVGIYGVIGYLVAQRRSEIGVRMALGARVPQVVQLVMLQSVRLTIVGVAIGLVGAIIGTRVLRSLLFGVSPTDPLVLGIAPLVLVAIAAVASFAPARRAARVDPAEALRAS
jgi:predicted permease